MKTISQSVATLQMKYQSHYDTSEAEVLTPSKQWRRKDW